MKLWSKSATVLVSIASLIHPTSAGASNLHQNPPKAQSEVRTIFQVHENNSTTIFVEVLSDHPGRATALTPKQKSEIREILAKSKSKAKDKGNRSFVCTGLSLAGQRESMYRVVRLRAKLVCEYAKSVDSTVKTTVKEKVVTARNLNGRVEVVSK